MRQQLCVRWELGSDTPALASTQTKQCDRRVPLERGGARRARIKTRIIAREGSSQDERKCRL